MDFNVLYIVIVLAVILFSMTLHEAMHAFMGYWLGDDTAQREGRLTLNPIKHIDPILTVALPVFLAVIGGPIFGGAKPVPFNPDRLRYDEWGAALVAVAGPLTNLLIAFVTFGIATLAGVTVSDFAFLGLSDMVLSTIVYVNLGFFVFNMIPIPPLDGSRVLYALAPEFVRRGMEWIEQFSLILVFAIVLLASQQIGLFMQAAIELVIGLFSGIFGA